MSGHDQTYYKLAAKQFKNKEEVLEWVGNLQQKIIKLQEQLAAQEERNDRIIDLLTESQLHELKKMDEEEEEDESDDESEDLCIGCGSSEVKFTQCGGEVGCNICENCFK